MTGTPQRPARRGPDITAGDWIVHGGILFEVTMIATVDGQRYIMGPLYPGASRMWKLPAGPDDEYEIG